MTLFRPAATGYRRPMARAATYDRNDALDAAMRLFWTKGYHATSMKDLEQTLSMRPGSIYAAFHSKEQLFRETLDRYSARMEADLTRLVMQSPAPLKALQSHLLSLADLTPCDRPSTACMLVKSLLELPQDGELRDFITDHLDRVEALIAAALKRSAQLGELPDSCDPDRLARRIQTYIFGLKIQAQRQKDPQRMQELCGDLAEELGRIGGGAVARTA
ncbi:MAG: TetR/AcrR family transcriptional regulator [Pseudomonadota bacterium]|uniref:TetR/AcrR family transcriptional regulator n=1 Tax=Pseudooceanicola nitratireducens TaxID=517719 RepID=UPI001FCFC0B9|nr:TetR/AcrR family transcriptional regulator [Pseudooceanicola nitratireducens]MEC7298017.1 TetR/AcrR family transcriptional regulator [Pseudomonadota bacterium]MEC7791935.1 TetR/AcrR family transcriptional regulator [Pseudomonadota bacterium]MEC8666325.1 TetR/AcrR family transcriptional regulator [Pseudomonadota bacterium]MEC9104011.1 TetR/AcrR family transcriptional regulator [Pseudomonadota bacterium]